MKITWQPTGAATPTTLGDDATKHTIEIGEFGGEVVAQVDPLARGANPFVKDRGNVSGAFTFVATQSYADLDAALVALANAYALLSHANGCIGALVWTRSTTIKTFNSALLQSVRLAGINGVRVSIGYKFLLRTVT